MTLMCEHKENKPSTEVGLWIQCRDAKTWEEQAELARKIANLPERTVE